MCVCGDAEKLISPSNQAKQTNRQIEFCRQHNTFQRKPNSVSWTLNKRTDISIYTNVNGNRNDNFPYLHSHLATRAQWATGDGPSKSTVKSEIVFFNLVRARTRQRNFECVRSYGFWSAVAAPPPSAYMMQIHIPNRWRDGAWCQCDPNRRPPSKSPKWNKQNPSNFLIYY